MTTRPRVYVDPPTVSPSPYGLWSVIQPAEDTDQSHWRLGVQFQPDPCEPAGVTLADCPPPDDDPDFGKESTGSLGTVGANPFAVYGWVDCGPVGGVWEESRQRAAAALRAGEARTVERVFWAGVTPAGTVYPHLAADTEVTDPGPGEPAAHQVLIQPAAEVVGSGPLPVVNALAELESALGACYPGVGVIHMTRGAAIHLASHSLLIRQGPQLRTPLGTLVAVGGGYPGTGPDGTPPPAGSTWMYATGAVVGRRSEITMSTRTEALDRGRNHLVLIPERSYAIGWDCCLLAVETLLGVDL